jgi:biofilm PGA synthesis N-glycosyltransferase PgaC
MSGGPTATVVVPTRDGGQSLHAALKGLALQDARAELHVVIVDNGSTDGSVAAARYLADEVIVEPRPGTAPARAAGLQSCRTELMLMLDADCRPVQPSWARAHLEALAGAGADVIASAGRSVPAPGGDRWAAREDVTPHPAWREGRPQYAVGGNCCFRTGPLREIGGFPAVLNEDAAVGRAARAAGYRYVWTPDAVVEHVNPPGWLGYARQMRKVGRYAAEADATAVSPWRQAAEGVRRLAPLPGLLGRRDWHEAAALALRVGAQTRGAIEFRREAA